MGGIDTVIHIYKQTGSGIDFVDSLDNDNKSGGGESSPFIATDPGTYYFAFLGYDDSQQGLCQIEINSTAPEQTLTLEEGFGALDTTTTLPYSGQYDLGSELIAYDDGSGNLAYGTLFRVEAEADTLFLLNFWGSDDVGIDTTIYIYRQDGTNIVPVQTFDADSRGRGEAVKYMVSQAGTYYFGFLGADLEEIGLCRCDITAFPRDPSNKSGTLDFTVDPVPVPEAGDLWSWNEDTLTLTLMDGFSMQNDAVLTPTIKLPAGSTVILEGSASLYTDQAQSILCLGDLTIRGSGPDTSQLTGLSYADDPDCQPIYAQGKLTVEDCTLDLNSYATAMAAEGSMEIRNTRLQLDTDREGLASYADVSIQGSEIDILAYVGIYAENVVDISTSHVTINSVEYGIHAEDASISGSDVSIDAPYNECIYTDAGVSISDQSVVHLISYADEGILTSGSVSIIDSTLDIDANEEGIQTYGDYGPTTEIKIQNSHVSVYSEEEEGIYLDSGSVIIIDSTLDIDADEEGIQAYDNYGPAELKIQDSDVSIRSNGEEGVDIYGPLSITGGQLKVAASENALEAESALLTDVLFDLVTYGDYLLVDLDSATGFSLPGDFFLYDSQDTQLYEGSWSSDLLDSFPDLQVNGISVKRAVSTSFYHVHQWSSQWYNDQDYHWHECEADYCLITDNSQKDGYGAHVYDCQVVSDAYLATEADCTSPATYYYSCVCGKAGSETFEHGQPLGHSWGEPTFDWSADGKTCTVSFSCDVCGEPESLAATVTSQMTTAPTCTAKGVTTYTATVTLDGQTYSDTLNLSDLAMLEHTYENGKCTLCGAEDPNDAPFVPAITQGANGTWQKGSSTGLSFSSDAERADFLRVQVDGKDVDSANYTLTDDGTNVTLKAAYLETLAVGKHTLAIVSQSGTALTTFTITAAPETAPKTGDGSSFLLGTLALVAASGVMAGMICYSRKKKGENN